MAIDLSTLSIATVHDALLSGEFSSVELAQAYLDQIAEKNSSLNAYLGVFDDVLEQARAADRVIREKKNDAPILCGIPIAIKDNILIKGRRCSSASKILENYTATYDADIIERLKAQGVVFLGRTNMDEFAMGGSSENSAYGPVKNPHDESRVPGGSSGGSAVAVAANMALVSIGSDTGGSVRQPGAFCGVVGMKPTYGVVSRYGLMAMASSLDQIGTFGKSAEDAQVLFEAIAGHDERDSTSYPADMRTSRPAKDKLTVGVPEDFLKEGVDSDVLENFRATLKGLEDAGHTVKSVEIPYIEQSLATYYIIMPAESSTNLARFDGIRYGLSVEGADTMTSYMKTRAKGFGKEVRRRIMLGTYVLSAGYYDAYYNKAIAVRQYIRDGFEKAFEDVDIIATPTSPFPAFKIGERLADPLQMYLSDIFTVPANIAGVPGLSVPCGAVVREGTELPLGLHIMSPQFCEESLFALARDVENATR